MPGIEEPEALLAKQFETVDEQHEELRNKLRLGRFGGIVTPDDYAEFNSMCLALIDRAASRRDALYEQAVREIEKYDLGSSVLATSLYGLVSALKQRIATGVLTTAREADRAEMLGSLFEIAAGMLAKQRKDAAAVLLGSALDMHLRNLAAKYGDNTDELDGLDHGARTSPEELNVELGSTVYSMLEQQSVADWLKLWHDVTRGASNSYSAPRVALFLDGLRLFVARYPA